jgi:valyl-tRNA synthetase
MEKHFDPKSYEGRWQRYWAEHRLFLCDAESEKKKFCIMIPPPNVTGQLHMGHALQSTLQDLLTRRRRMQGYEALWLPGTDHAGIATQLMVERQLAAEGTDRHALGRERFLDRMWSWKDLYHGNIRRQLDRLGASCDWSRERFTLDPGLSRAVCEAFVRLHGEGLIYRAEYLVNWSPVLETAISDLEVETRPVQGKLYHIAYAVEGEAQRRVVVATTRPETMLGDCAVAFHPDDSRYADLAGRHAILPILGRRIPFVADSGVEPEFGTGLVKVTPNHDAFDFELARRHGLPGISVIDRRGAMTAAAGEEYAGLDRFEARRRIVERLREDGQLLRVEDHAHNVGHSQRSGEPIEPLVSLQWFCDPSGMAAQALAAARDGRLQFVPETWGKTWEHWLENIKPWCISRQLWWGHQIPAWYTEDGRCFVAAHREDAEAAAGTNSLTQDADVLDTWFSSALWPFSTLGWPAHSRDLRAFYPTDVLVTGFDILFFWVARMVMTGLHFTGEVPFRTVHLTGLVRDAEGQKMSKTKGNVVNPEQLIDEHGADALRFTLAVLDSPGRDIALDAERIAGYRAFGNKLWNATRFALQKVGPARVALDLTTAGLALPERWILSRLARTEVEVNRRFEEFRFDEGCNRLYHFFWGDLCDWYIELVKPALATETPRPRAAEVLLSVLDRGLRLLHPVMPFLTEELWQRLPGHEAIHPASIALAAYPEGREDWLDDVAERDMATLIELISAVRSLRVEHRVSAKAEIELSIDAVSPDLRARLQENHGLLSSLARLSRVQFAAPPAGAVRSSTRELAFAAVLPRAAADAVRDPTEARKLSQEIERCEARLDDAVFLAKAPAAIVAGARARLAELRARLAALGAAAARSGGGA